MGVAILVLVIGIPAGLFVLLRPRKLWWATQSWKYKNPDANEPSDTSYAMTSVSGLFIIGLSIFLAVMAWSSERDRKEHEAQQKQREEWDAAVKAYTPPAPEDRGALPVIGYVLHPAGSVQTASVQTAEVYFLQPPGAAKSGYRHWAQRGLRQCVTSARVQPAPDHGPAQLHVQLRWAPDVPQKDNTASDSCTTRDIASTHEIVFDSVTIDGDAGYVTDSPIVDRDGNVLVPAGPANVVPKLDRAPR